MPDKLQLFYIMKFSSRRLREQPPTNLTLSQARRNGEVVSVGDSELLRLIRRIQRRNATADKVERLKAKRRQIKMRQDSPENRSAIASINQELDELLFVPELIIVRFDNVSHYKKFATQGIFINGRRFVRLMAGAGHTRRASVIFCDEELHSELDRRLNNGRNRLLPMNEGKFGSYFALVSSATHSVSVPRFVIVPDYEYERHIEMDMLVKSDVDGVDHQMVAGKGTYTKNAFDGQGIVSPSFAARWASELGLSYVPSCWVFRGVFLKGGLVTFPFIDLAIERNAYTIKDIWGTEHDIFNVDVILSNSQFKMAGGYDSFEEYLRNCRDNGFGWGISRFSPETDRFFARLNYQYIQVLNLTEQEKIDALCQPTINWLKDISGDDARKTLLYLLGELTNSEPSGDWFDRLDTHTKIILLEGSFVYEPAIQQTILSSLRRIMRDACLGKLLVNGNYQGMIADPVAQVEWALGLPVKGVVREGRAYSNFWNKRNTTKIAALRAPLTWRSEVNILDLETAPDAERWLSGIASGIVFSIYDDSAARMSGADYDGDMCMTTDSPTVIENAFGGNIVSYERNISRKGVIENSEMWMSDSRSMKNRIGFITNVGTTYYSMLSLYEPGTPQYEAIINRLKLLFCFQSMEIDKTKGIDVLDFPLWWTKWSAVRNVPEETRQIAHFNNGILCQKRPYFFRHLYRRYDVAYRHHRETFDNFCQAKFGFGLDELLSNTDLDENQRGVLRNYHRYCPLVETDSPMNMIARTMEKMVVDIRKRDFGISILQQIIPDIDDADKKKMMMDLFRLYNTMRKEVHHLDGSQLGVIHEIKQRAEETISSYSDELLFLAVHTDVRFAIQIFGDELVLYLMTIFGSRVLFPVRGGKEGDTIEYLGEKYHMRLVDIHEQTDNHQRKT